MIVSLINCVLNSLESIKTQIVHQMHLAVSDCSLSILKVEHTCLILLPDHVLEDVVVEERLNAPLSRKCLLQLSLKSKVIEL